MCKYFETTHTYSACKLREGTEDGTKDSSLVPLLASLLATTTEDGSAPKVLPHVIRRKTIVQCDDAIKDPVQRNLPPGQRICSAPTAILTDENNLVETSETFYKGDCPVCDAVEKAVENALDMTVFVSSLA
jgi:hypothetical protein